MSTVGSASYTPGKHALRGLTETFCSEFKLTELTSRFSDRMMRMQAAHCSGRWRRLISSPLPMSLGWWMDERYGWRFVSRGILYISGLGCRDAHNHNSTSRRANVASVGVAYKYHPPPIQPLLPKSHYVQSFPPRSHHLIYYLSQSPTCQL